MIVNERAYELAYRMSKTFESALREELDTNYWVDSKYVDAIESKIYKYTAMYLLKIMDQES